MAKATKKEPPNRPKKYDDKLIGKGSFLDIMKAAVKDAKNKDKKKP